MKRRIVGRFWQYDGNSINGIDHERKTPKGYTFNTVKMVCFIGQCCDCYGYGNFDKYVTKEEAKQIEVIHHKGDYFGHEITVKAPKSVWEKAKVLE